jgi:hypothetical protein
MLHFAASDNYASLLTRLDGRGSIHVAQVFLVFCFEMQTPGPVL